MLLNEYNLDCNDEIVKKIRCITESHILHLIKCKTNNQNIEEIYICLQLMLNENYEKYIFNTEIVEKFKDNELDEEKVQQVFSKLNEKQAVRKKNGVYYTPKDVVSFVVDNCFYQKISKSTQIISSVCLYHSNKNIQLISSATVFDPTCGTGEFLLYALEKKIELIKDKYNDISDEELLDILDTIHGNDININSIEITKIRLFFKIIKYSKSSNYYRFFANIINKNISCIDFINIETHNFKQYDIIIGNPPYVEDRNSLIKPVIRYGNIYANVLQNSIDILKQNGIIGFIIPISYASTQRMNIIRKYIEQHTETQLVLNYADRPDCLFTSVHQKLSIIFAIKGDRKHKLYTSGYKYWYKNERENLFQDVDIIENEFMFNDFYPKIGNNIENSIFKKVFTNHNDNLLDSSSNNNYNVFLNMRACFWIKAFSFNPGSNEYKGFSYDEHMKYFVLCILNSSLFFLFWNIVSDCWHITSKELKYFKLPNELKNIYRFTELSKKLEHELELTKKYIGTRQTEYEYKHKLCKGIIDEIDKELANIYMLTDEELKYVITYVSKYRKSLGQ